MFDTVEELTRRHLAVLREIASGHCECSAGSWPSLYVNGQHVCGQEVVRDLAQIGLFRRSDEWAREAHGEVLSPSVLTERGRAALERAPQTLGH